jgi:hypothetical protein
MIRRLSTAAALCVVAACSPDSTQAPPVASAESFTGAWRSTTPSFEFVRLSVSSKSSEQGALAARLTLSGVAWEGSGRIDADSVVATMLMAGSTTPAGALVVHAAGAQTLRVRLTPTSAAGTELTFVRDE